MPDLAKLAAAYYRNPSADKKETIVNIIYTTLEEVIALALKALRDCFGIETTSQTVIDSLTYQGDNKTISDRVNIALAESQKVSFHYLLFRMLLILSNEARTVYNELVYNTLSDSSLNIWFEIVQAEDCCTECEEEYAGMVGPIEMLTERPPFHPDCQCQIVYFTK
jgi:hypothetical protein